MKTLRNLHLLVLLVLTASCSTNPSPNPPPSRGPFDLSIVVIQPGGIRVPGATLTVDGRTLTANANGWAYTSVAMGPHTAVAEAPDFHPSEPVTWDIQRHTRKVILIEPLAPRPPPLGRLTTDGKIFRSDGQPWRYRGVSAFKMLDRFAAGEDISPLLKKFQGFNVLRVFWYVTWPVTGWEPTRADQVAAFCNRVAQDGFYVELVLLTDDDPARIPQAQRLVQDLTAADSPPVNLLLEAGNEPHVHKNIDVWALRSVLEASPFLYASGENEMLPFFGKYLTAHTPRDNEWPRKVHDLLEYYSGGGPAAPTDPAHPVPGVADEPMRPDEAGYVESDYLAYFAGASLMGAGATFHYAGGKFNLMPTEGEERCMNAALAGLMAFPADAPLGAYQRIDEQGATLRTYKVGPWIVRIRPTDGRVLPNAVQ